MPVSVGRDAVMKKKQVRFARTEDEDDKDDQEEDTLFDKRKDTRRGLKSALKAGKRGSKQGREGVEIIGGKSNRGAHGSCRRWLVTLVTCASFLGLGMCISVLGPTFEDLAQNVNKDVSNISYIFVGRSSGYIGGSLLGGILIDCMNPHILLGISMLVTAIGMCATPFCKHALLLTGLMSSIGLTMGILDTAGNVLILKTWGSHAGPHMQALHFSFAIGSFMSPIIAKLLFSSELKLRFLGTSGVPVAATLPTATATKTAVNHTLQYYIKSAMGDLNAMWAYIVIGAFSLLVSLFFFILCCHGRPLNDEARTPSGKPLVAKHHNALIILMFCFFFWYVGAELSYGSFIFTYAKDYANMDQPQAAGLNSLFWGAFATCRGLAIFFAACMRPGTMILLSLVGTTLSSLLLCLFSKKRLALWICTGVYGASMAVIFPSGISWVEQYTTLSGRSASGFVVGAGLGEMVLPTLVGYLMGRFKELPLMMYQSLLTAVITSILFPVMFKLASAPSGQLRRFRGRGCPDPDDGEYRQALLASGANEEDEEQEEGERADIEADQWNEADFEVIEMDDAASLSSPKKEASLPGDAAFSGAVAASDGVAGQLPSPASSSSDTTSLIGESPRRKLLLSLSREKKD